MIYIGIDPGTKGCIAFINDTSLIAALRFEIDLDIVINRLKILRNKDVRIFIEDVHALYGVSATSSFSFGRELGRIIGILQAFDLDFLTVPPTVWQGAVCRMPAKPKKGDTTPAEYAKVKKAHKLALKIESCRAAHEAFPELETKNDGICDSVNIARYCREYHAPNR